MNNEELNIDVQKLKPFTRFIYTIGVLPTSYLLSMTYEEQLIWLCNYLKETVIPTVNNNGLAVEELQAKYIELKSYVDNYFDNLNVQEEINNKLDEMVEDGTFQTLLADYLVLNTITVKVPTDYATIEEAINDLSYKDIKANKEIIILIEENHKLTKGLKLINGDYSHYRIKSENNYVVQLAESFVGYNGTDLDHPNTDGTDNSLFVGINCTFPIIDCLFDMENNFGDGMELYLATGYINNGAGVINAGRYGCYAKDSSKVFAEGSIWSGSNSAGVRLQHATCGTFNHCVLDGCCKTDNTLGSAYISKQCICQIRESTISNNTTCYGLLARRSRVDIEEAEISDCNGGIRAEGGSFISASDCEIDGITVKDSIESVNSIVVGGICSNSSHLDFFVAYGGIILDAQQSTNGNGTVALADCRNIRAFNVMGDNGMINIHNNGTPTYSYNKQNITNGILITYPSHAEMILNFSKATTSDIATGENGYIELTNSDIAIPSGYTVNSLNWNVNGRTSASGGGNTVLVNSFFNKDINYLKLYNTGLSNGAETTIKSVNIFLRVILIPS